MIVSAQSQSTRLKAKLFRGFSDPSRLAILDVLRSRAMTVSEIVEATGLSQSNTSNHLGCLRDCGLVTPYSKDGTRAINSPMHELLRFWKWSKSYWLM